MGRPGEGGGGRPQDVLWTNACRLGLFLRGKKLKIAIVFISQSYFKVPSSLKLNATHYFTIKISNKRELQQIPSHHSSDIDCKDFMKL